MPAIQATRDQIDPGPHDRFRDTGAVVLGALRSVPRSVVVLISRPFR
ncbi:hypothetical protein [Rhodococcus sp. PBTS 1]|nr:hypothetical protein [Rhodococcus sp. PBTS 1]AMY17421.1 hypothetical protein A3Q40_00006 [Rhodococcus sp. PBTS 1]